LHNVTGERRNIKNQLLRNEMLMNGNVGMFESLTDVTPWRSPL
jgi:hypothetical protein